jgi:hypothetical protein
MGEVIDDEALETFAVMGDADHVAAEIRRRFGGLVDRVQLGLHGSDPESAAGLVTALRR